MQYDAGQRAVIDFHGGRALVLAAPGCGKTEILAQRVVRAHQYYGIPYQDMLCLTFTNRASRDMSMRVARALDPGSSAPPRGLFVGNLHRYCMRMLFQNELMSPDADLLDEEDALDVVSELAGRRQSPSRVSAVQKAAAVIWAKAHDVDPGLVTRSRLSDADYELGSLYGGYKRSHDLTDFQDLLLLAYRALRDVGAPLAGAYPWIQVDEVQDLSPLQMAIIDLLAAPAGATVVYLGDQRQAIYSFIGAEAAALGTMAAARGITTFRLDNNYRSSPTLVAALNAYATAVLDIDPAHLPRAVQDSVDPGDAASRLLLVNCRDYPDALRAVTGMVRRHQAQPSPGDVALLVRTNREVHNLSRALREAGIRHMALSNVDMFKGAAAKTLYAHLSATADYTAHNAWARLLYAAGAARTIGEARQTVRRLRGGTMSVADLVRRPGSTYGRDFLQDAWDQPVRPVVVFDTETTGLDVEHDDVIQIAAVRVRAGKVVPGSEWSVLIETSRPIPAELKAGVANPMVEVYANGRPLPRRQALQEFLDYIGDSPLLGHNVDFDVQILVNNLRREGLDDLPGVERRTWDTLVLSRLIEPGLRSHSLGALVEMYGLEGANTHRADDDVHATFLLARVLAQKMRQCLPYQAQLLDNGRLRAMARRLIQAYSPLYYHTRQRQWLPGQEVAAEMRHAYQYMTLHRMITPLARPDYLMGLWEKMLPAGEQAEPFVAQRGRWLAEMRSFNEGDLYKNGILDESVHVMTVHKAKGLEFDTVIVADASETTYPYANAWSDPQEDARVLYVALSRARHRLWVAYRQRVSPFLADPPVRDRFFDVPADLLMTPDP